MAGIASIVDPNSLVARKFAAGGAAKPKPKTNSKPKPNRLSTGWPLDR